MENKEKNTKSNKEPVNENKTTMPVNKVDKLINGGNPELSVKHTENHDSCVDDNTESRLNPDSEIITEKDPDETILLPNNELKRMNNWKNRNQPF